MTGQGTALVDTTAGSPRAPLLPVILVATVVGLSPHGQSAVGALYQSLQEILPGVYTNAGNDFDCSVDDPVSGMVPSSYLVSGLELTWSGKDFRYLNGEGKLIASDPTAQEIGPPALLVDSHAMSEFLRKEDLALVWTVLGEKQIAGSGWDQSAYKGHLETYGFLALEADEVNQISAEYEFKEPQHVN